MEGYTAYQEFLDELLLWGDAAVYKNAETGSSWEMFLQLWMRSKQGAQEGVFSPFLYLVLSAGLSREEAMFLAAVFYSGLASERERLSDGGGETEKSTFQNAFRFSFWKRFWPETEKEVQAALLFYQTAPLLFERETDGKNGELCIRLLPRVFLFLSKGILEQRTYPCLYWYHHSGEPLPFLGASACKFEQMDRCRKQESGKMLFYLHGKRGSGRKLNYAYLAEKQGKSLAVMQYEKLHTRQELQELLVECILHHACLAVEFTEQEEDPTILLQWMAEEETLFFLGEWEEFPFHIIRERQYVSFEIDAQKVLNDQELFRKLTGEYSWESEAVRADFLGRYTFLPGKMRNLLELAKAYAFSEGRAGIAGQDLKRAILRLGGHSLRKYAKKIDGIYIFDDLILPPLQKQKLSRICSRVRNKKHVYEEWGFSEKSAYGNGVSMIFAGPPGTGKTMAAQVIAAELGMELYRVELPAVVDKYIGETEKKLNRIFDEAQKSMAILFFDEADVLFSKRTEIKESNDKYSNMEIAFLLQKMEEHEGVSILATNYLQNFDEAFRRRIQEIVDFPMPDVSSREKMWLSMIPKRLPVSEDLDFRFLAEQFQVTGSMIKNALIYGSFLAAEASEQILTMEMVLQGIAHELEKSGKKLKREDYGEYSVLI